MNTPKRQPRSRPETVQKRDDILRAAAEIFGSKGSANGTLAEIADQVGMTHAGVLHHFGSKEQLLLEVIKHRDFSDVEHLEPQRIPEGEQLFHHLIRTAFANIRRAGIVQAYAVLSAESVTDGHPARDYFEDRYRLLRSQIAEAFVQLSAERGVDADSQAVKSASAAILAVMDGLQVQWLLDPTQVDLGRDSEFAINAIIAATLPGQKISAGE